MGKATEEAEETRRVLEQKGFECFLFARKRQQEEEGADGNSSARGWCPVVWDNVMCWDHAAPGTTVYQPCPAYIPKFKPHEMAVRRCMKDGTWEMNPNPALNHSWTNYTACWDPPDNIDITYHAAQADKLTLMYTVGYSVSLATLIIAVFIMLYCRRLRCKSNTMHINLFIAFILRASLAFLKDSLFVGHLGLPQDVTFLNGRLEFIQEGLHWECRLITVLFTFSISATQTWILMEGLYLYMLIHRTIVTERYGVKPYIIFGWVIPWVMVIPWIIVKHQFENTFCWNMQENKGYFWILNGPWVATVIINFFFFLDIFRVLFMRVRSTHRHVGSSKYRKFAKFILVLIPLFGIMYIVLLVAFPADQIHDEQQFNVVQLYIEMGYNSFQGFILALLFCFLNEDVHSELRRMWRRHKSRREDSKYLTRSLAGSTFRQVSRDHNNSPVPAKRVPRSASNNSWRKEALTNSQRLHRGPLEQQERASGQSNVPSAAGERRSLCLRFNTEPPPAEGERADRSPGAPSVSSQLGSKGSTSEGRTKLGYGGKAAVVRAGSGADGVPTRILLINPQTGADTSPPLSCSGEDVASSP